MTKIEQARAWAQLVTLISRIPDHRIREAMSAEFRDRAMREWGWCPSNSGAKESKPTLDEWEQQFYDDIQETLAYGVDARADKHETEEKEFMANIRKFVRDGGTLLDIPDEIRTLTVVKAYYQLVDEEGRDLDAAVDNLLTTKE